MKRIQSISIIFLLLTALIWLPGCKKDKKEEPPVIVFKADFKASPQYGEMPFTAHIQDETVGDPVWWKWDLNFDGTVDDQNQDPSFLYPDPGFYTIELISGNNTNSDTIVKMNYISVSSNAVSLSNKDLVTGNVNSEISIPVRSGQEVTLGAITLKILYDTYRLNLNGITDIAPELSGMQFYVDTLSGMVNIAWSSATPAALNPDQDLFSLVTYVKEKLDSSYRHLVIGDPTEFADENAQVIEGIELTIPLLDTPN